MAVEEKTQGRVPPHDLEAEQSVLGAILLDNEALDKVAAWLRPDDFYRKNHEDVYKAALDLHIQGEPADIVTVGNALQELGVIERVGGRAYLASLEGATPTALNVAHYGKIVKEKSTLRSLIRLGGDIAGRGYSGAEDVDQLVAEVQAQVFSLTDDRITEDALRVSELLPSFMDELNDGSADPPVFSGLSSLDDMLGGFIPGQLIIICGRPGMGKSAAGLNIALNAAKQNVPTAIFSLEMTKPELVTRFVAQTAHIECKVLDKARRGMEELSDRQVDKILRAKEVLEPLPLFIDDQAGMTDDVLVSKARRIALRERVGMIVVDYIGLLRSGDETNGNRVQEVGYICHKLKALAKDLRIPVLAMAQLNRGPEMRNDKRPMLSDLRESGDVEQDADVVIGMFRPSYYDESKHPEEAEAIVLKQRGGSTGTCPLRFRQEETRFYSVDRHHKEDIS